MDEQRAEFEAWARANGLIYESHGLLSVSSSLELFWQAWQAARAQPAQAGQVPITSETGNTPDQGASAITSESGKAGQVLTDDFIKAEALEAFDCYWDADDETLVNKYGHGVYLSRFIDFARAVEAAVLAKRVPMTQSDLIRMSQDYADIEDEETAFRDGWRRAEIHHGIVGEKGGA